MLWKKRFCRTLKKKRKNDPSSRGVPPIAVLCKDSGVTIPEKHQDCLKDVYDYEVLGGQHTTTAQLELHRKHPDNSLYTYILSEVYVGLTNDEALRFASRHNVNGNFGKY